MPNSGYTDQWVIKNLLTQSMSNEMGRLSQGNDVGVKANDCVYFIHHQYFPNNRNITYENFVCDCQPLKSDRYIIHLLVGGKTGLCL